MVFANVLQVDPPFRRAVNLLMYLVDYATRKSINAMRDGSYSEGQEQEMFDADENIREYWKRAFDYAKELRTAFSEHAAQVKREITRSKMSDVEWAKARQVSRTFNLERYTAGLGSQGLNAPSNVVVDAGLERASFSKDGTASGREKRWYYYGREVPGGHEVQAPYLNVSEAGSSPTKRRYNSERRSSSALMGGAGDFPEGN
jgi:hypothetical protein